MIDIAVEDRLIDATAGSIFTRCWRIARNDASASAPILLLHDSLGCVELWRDFPEALARTTGRTVIAYDRPGFGRSLPLRARPSVTFIDDEATGTFPSLVDALGLPRFALLGHSVGGAMALAIAAHAGDACEAVVSVSAQAFVEARTRDGIRAAQAAFDDADRFARLERWHGERARWVLDAWTGVWLSPGFSGWRLDPYLSRIACPVLAIHGDRDEYGSVAFPRRIIEGVPGASTLAILSGCGHVPHRERPDEVLSLVSTFLAPAVRR